MDTLFFPHVGWISPTSLGRHKLFKIKLHDDDGLRWMRFLHGELGTRCYAGLFGCRMYNRRGPTFMSTPKGGLVPLNPTIFWAFISPSNGWDCPCILVWTDVISKACNSFQEKRGWIKLEIFFYWGEKLNISGNVFTKMFLYFSVFPEHSDLNTSQDCATLERMKTKWI